MTADELRRLVVPANHTPACPSGPPISLGDLISSVASYWERLDRDTAAGFWADCLDLASDRENTEALRRLALSVANLARHSLEGGRVPFDAAWEFAYAVKAVNKEARDDR